MSVSRRLQQLESRFPAFRSASSQRLGVHSVQSSEKVKFYFEFPSDKSSAEGRSAARLYGRVVDSLIDAGSSTASVEIEASERVVLALSIGISLRLPAADLKARGKHCFSNCLRTPLQPLVFPLRFNTRIPMSTIKCQLQQRNFTK